MKTSEKKQKSHAFGKDVYLLGKDKDGIKYWLEAPKWDCGWYWGFGYIETYQQNWSPEKARDINSHSHFSGFVGQQEKYYSVKGCFVKADFIHNIYDNSLFKSLTFTQTDGWKLSELFKQFYLLRDMADFCHKKPSPGCNLTTVAEVNHGDMTELYDKINKVMIPAITTEILRILTPEQKNTVE